MQLLKVGKGAYINQTFEEPSTSDDPLPTDQEKLDTSNPYKTVDVKTDMSLTNQADLFDHRAVLLFGVLMVVLLAVFTVWKNRGDGVDEDEDANITIQYAVDKLDEADL